MWCKQWHAAAHGCAPVTAHGTFTVGHYPLSAIGTYSASTTPRAKGGGSSCALNTPDHFNTWAQGRPNGAHRPLNRQHTRPATPTWQLAQSPPLASGSTGCDHYTERGTNRLLTDHPISSAPWSAWTMYSDVQASVSNKKINTHE
jgi:hypothetical protein